jgi:hypothetical protein
MELKKEEEEDLARDLELWEQHIAWRQVLIAEVTARATADVMLIGPVDVITGELVQ